MTVFVSKYAPPAKVSPAVIFMAHESCPFTGEILSCGAGVAARWLLAEVDGYTNLYMTAEDVRDNIAQIFDDASYNAFPKLIDLLDGWVKKVTEAAQVPYSRLTGSRKA
jgi:hypothetical protein